MKIIDLSAWERTAHYQFFRHMDYAQYNMSVNLDITAFIKRLKEENLPFYYAMIYGATVCINREEAFRYRIRGEEVILQDRLHPSFTDMPHDSDLFKMVTVDLEENEKIDTFARKANAQSAVQRESFVRESLMGRDDLIFITSIPWVSFTHLSHTISLRSDDAIPRLAWGKYYKEGNQILLPFSVQAHHSFVDGIHMGRYINGLQDWLDHG